MAMSFAFHIYYKKKTIRELSCITHFKTDLCSSIKVVDTQYGQLKLETEKKTKQIIHIRLW